MKTALKKNRISKLAPVLGLVLFTLAIWVLHRELQAHHYEDIIEQFDQIPTRHLWVALLLTMASYGIMTGYDVLALRFIQHPLAYGKIALASFVSYAFSNSIGLSMIAGASVRYRLYTAWGLSGLEVSKIVFFCRLTLWLGFFHPWRVGVRIGSHGTSPGDSSSLFIGPAPGCASPGVCGYLSCG